MIILKIVFGPGKKRDMPTPGFEPGSEAPQAPMLSKLYHVGFLH